MERKKLWEKEKNLKKMIGTVLILKKKKMKKKKKMRKKSGMEKSEGKGREWGRGRERNGRVEGKERER